MKQIFALGFIFVCTSIAWMILGGTILSRTHQTDQKLKRQVSSLWGERLQQSAPHAFYPKSIVKKVWNYRNRTFDKETVLKKVTQPLCGSDINVRLKLDLRRKGLLWYSTYRVEFKGRYCLQNHTAQTRTLDVAMALPSRVGVFDNVDVLGRQTPSSKPASGLQRKTRKFTISSSNEIRFTRTLKSNEQRWVTITYNSRGLEEWKYSFGNGNQRVENFNLRIHTDFTEYDFPAHSLSPNLKKKTKKGMLLSWKFKNLITGANLGVTTPRPLDPGKFASRISFNAPVGLFLFFFALWMFTNLQKTPLHPMHFFFVACACFSFQLLMAYTADLIPLEASFVLSAAVSILLVVSYLRFPLGWKKAILGGGVSQLIYIVLFSAAFFLDGFTGLTITLLCIITLFIVMQVTGDLDWTQIFQGKADDRKPKPPPHINTMQGIKP